MSTGSNNREAACSIPSSPPSSLLLSVPARGPSESGEHQQSRHAASLTLPPPAREELLWWQERLSQWNGKALVCQKETVMIRSNTSLQEWGAVCSGTRTRGPRSQEEQEMHINCLELLAATLAVQSFLKTKHEYQCCFSSTIRWL